MAETQVLRSEYPEDVQPLEITKMSLASETVEVMAATDREIVIDHIEVVSQGGFAAEDHSFGLAVADRIADLAAVDEMAQEDTNETHYVNTTIYRTPTAANKKTAAGVVAGSVLIALDDADTTYPIRIPVGQALYLYDTTGAETVDSNDFGTIVGIGFRIWARFAR